MKKTILLFALFTAQFLVAQTSDNPDTTRIATIDQMAVMKGFQTNSYSSVLQTFDFRYEGVRGSRYFVDDFAEGELWLTNNRHHAQKDVRYKFDEIENAILVRYPNGKEILADAKEVVRFRLDIGGSSVYYFASIPPNSDSHAAKLMQVIYAGNRVSIVKLPFKKLIRVDKTGAYTSNERYDEFEDKGQYFVKMGDKPFVEIKRVTKKGLIAAMPTKRTKLQNLYDNIPKYANAREISDALLAEIGREVDVKKDEKEVEN